MLKVRLKVIKFIYFYFLFKVNHEEIDKNINTLFKIVHVTNFNVSIQALMLLNQVVESRDDMLNRYYNALYRKIFDLESKNTSKQTYFLNLLFSSISKDDALPRIRVLVH
jgi:ribosome biogenesis protein MAK21